jgi:succinate dehydrogenase, cytochrome b556 subunit
MYTDKRPLSPHLQIYKPQWTWVPSILTRITGGAITVGSLLVVYWLVALACGPEAYATAQAFFGNVLVKIVLFGFTWALMFHTLGGIRHLVWDFGIGVDIRSAERTAKLTVVASVVLTVLVWIAAYAV